MSVSPTATDIPDVTKDKTDHSSERDLPTEDESANRAKPTHRETPLDMDEDSDDDESVSLPPLVEIVSQLGKLTPETMNSFYRFHTAVYNNLDGRPNSRTREILNSFRFALRSLWGEGGASITDYLQIVYDIANDTDFLMRSLAKKRDVSPLIRKLKESIRRCIDSAAILEKNSKDISLRWPKCEVLLSLKREVPPQPQIHGKNKSQKSSWTGYFSNLIPTVTGFDDGYDRNEYYPEEHSRYDDDHSKSRGPVHKSDLYNGGQEYRRSEYNDPRTKGYMTSAKAPKRSSSSDSWSKTMLDAARPNGQDEKEKIPVLLTQFQSLIETHHSFWKKQRNLLTPYAEALSAGKALPPIGIPNLQDLAEVLPNVLSEVKLAAQTLLEPVTD